MAPGRSAIEEIIRSSTCDELSLFSCSRIVGKHSSLRMRCVTGNENTELSGSSCRKAEDEWQLGDNRLRSDDSDARSQGGILTFYGVSKVTDSVRP